MNDYRPRARHAGLLVQPLDDELLLFDSERSRAHSLNATAAAVWRACDGQRDRDALAECCGIDQPTLSLALERLSAAHLLDGVEVTTGGRPDAVEGVSRRLMLRRSLTAGAALGAAIPVIRSITAPTPALAASNHKGKAGAHCSTGASCSPGSFCNMVSFNSCQKSFGTSCSHGSSCAHYSGAASACASGTCGSFCTATSQCPPGYTCSKSLCVN